MSKMGSKAGWFVGGFVAFAASFLGVALVRGASLSEVPPFRWFASEKPADEPAPGAESAANPAHGGSPATPALAPESKPAATPIFPTMTAGVLGAFVLPSPYDARELHDLDLRLKEKLASVAAAEERLKRREQELSDWQASLEARAQELAALRASPEAAPDANAADSPGKGMTPAAAASWRALAPLFESGDAEEAAQRLGQLDPEEAAHVLRGLDPERCAEILNALPKERYKSYLDAWRRSNGDQGKTASGR